MTGSHFNAEDSQLITDLHRISKKSPKLIKSTVYVAPSDPTIQVQSWKMNEFKYYDVPSPFPTLARGLFSRELSKEHGSDEHRYQIVARGYDKFFNIGEVPWTDWSSLEAHTGPDYTLSVKSNGCIIFIAAISPSKLIVTSKHALGSMDGVRETHSQAGHRWLKTHLASKGKSEEQLAAALWEKNWTAIAELCDDSFEEHVLPYPPEKSGLYLHGINESRKVFHTLPTYVIDEFAQEWGFLKTVTTCFNTLAQVKDFTDEVAKTGKWNGEPLEGFVIRTGIVDPKPGLTSCHKRPPYPTGSSFFFKVKFDEPYMMYRDWREITKLLLSTDGLLDHVTIPKSKMKHKETHVYLKWVKNEIKTNRSAFQEYTQGKGIIYTRERFLRWLGTEQGKMDMSDIEHSGRAEKNFDKTVIMPVAVPGCGKTSVAVTLAHLFNFGHTQSDDVQGKKSGPAFIKNVVSLLKEHDVVIADKNNHMRQHREALREAISKIYPPVRLLALNWTLDQPRATILRVCGDRILDRGDKHQTLRADKARKSHEDVIWQFIQHKEELADSEVDDIIEMRVEDSFEAAIARAVDGCVNILGRKRPSQEQIDKAVAVAKMYAPAKKRRAGKEEKEAKGPRYFGILAEVELESLVAPQFEQEEDIPCDGRTVWRKLVDDKRITDRPHITIVHQAGLPADADLWKRCTTLDQLPSPPLFSFTFGHLLWNDRVMVLTVEDLEFATEPSNEVDPGQEKHEFISKLPAEVRDYLHITVGTLDGSVPPYEAKGLVEAWHNGKQTGIGVLELSGLSAGGRMRGLMS